MYETGVVEVVALAFTLNTVQFKEPVFAEATTGAVVRSDEAIRKEQDRNLKQTREREAANALAMIIVGFPVYLYHWKVLQRDHEKLEVKD